MKIRMVVSGQPPGPETPIRKYDPTLHKITKQKLRSRSHRGGSPKSRIIQDCV